MKNRKQIRQAGNNDRTTADEYHMLMDWITDRHIKRATLKYINIWIESDSKLCSKVRTIAPKNEEDAQNNAAVAIHEAARKYRVVRHFSTENQGRDIDDKAAKKAAFHAFWRTVHEKVRKHQNSDPLVADPDLADDLGNWAKSSNGELQVLTSAASKLLWFVGNQHVRIYDRQAVAALRGCLPTETKWPWQTAVLYPDFQMQWNASFEEVKLQIKDIITKFEREELLSWSSLDSKSDPIFLKDMGQCWFRERVFDQMLWTRGSGGQGTED